MPVIVSALIVSSYVSAIHHRKKSPFLGLRGGLLLPFHPSPYLLPPHPHPVLHPPLPLRLQTPPHRPGCLKKSLVLDSDFSGNQKYSVN